MNKYGDATDAYTVIHADGGIIIKGLMMPLGDYSALMAHWAALYPDAKIQEEKDCIAAVRFKDGQD